jgi:hypothetical protein
MNALRLKKVIKFKISEMAKTDILRLKMDGHGIFRGEKNDDYFHKILEHGHFDKLEFTEIIALKLVLNICKKFNFIWILIEFSITITECNALAHNTLLLQQLCFLTKTIVVMKSFTTPPCRGVIYERALYLDLQSVLRI